MRRLNKRCRYICSIHDKEGRPEFRVCVKEDHEEDIEFIDSTPKLVWNKVLDQIMELRQNSDCACIQLFPQYIPGEDLFGLTEPVIVRILECLPGVDSLRDYKFKYGKNPFLVLPLAINPSGSARTEARTRPQNVFRRPHAHRTVSSSSSSSIRPIHQQQSLSMFSSTGSCTYTSSSFELHSPYTKQFVHSKSSQYKKMKQEWKNNVYLAPSKIQGLGLYASRDLEKHTMVIEYIGEIIRSEVAEIREKKYEAKNRGVYMFRLDEDRVIDATLIGGQARYINHSCNPNCVSEIVEIDKELRIILFAKRRISHHEEVFIFFIIL